MGYFPLAFLPFVRGRENRIVHHDCMVLHELALYYPPIRIGRDLHDPIVACIATPPLLSDSVISLFYSIGTERRCIRT